MLLRRLAEEHNFTFRKKLFAPYLHGRSDLGVPGADPPRFVIPLTYMNRSGAAVRRSMRSVPGSSFADLSSLLVVCDTLDLPPGRLRLRKGGSSAGHNGLKSIIADIDSPDFLRLYVGIGRPARREDVVDYVLGHFGAEEREAIEDALARGARAIRELLIRPFDEVVGGVNSRSD